MKKTGWLINDEIVIYAFNIYSAISLYCEETGNCVTSIERVGK